MARMGLLENRKFLATRGIRTTDLPTRGLVTTPTMQLWVFAFLLQVSKFLVMYFVILWSNNKTMKLIVLGTGSFF